MLPSLVMWPIRITGVWDSFGKFDQFGCALPDLGDTARPGLQVIGMQGLYGIDNHQLGLQGGNLFEDPVGIRLGEDIAGIRIGPDALCAHGYLPLAFLPGDIQGAQGDLQGHLQHQRALADPGFSPNQREGAGHQAAPEYPVEFRVAAGKPHFPVGGDFAKAYGF